MGPRHFSERRRDHLIRATAWALALNFLANTAHGQALSAKQLLQRCREAHAYCEKIRMEVETKKKDNIRTGKEASNQQIISCRYLRIGPMFDIVGNYHYDGTLVNRSFNFHHVVNKGGWVETRYVLGKQSRPSGGSTSRDPHRGMQHILELGWYSTPMDGYFGGGDGSTLQDLLEHSEGAMVRPGGEATDGARCWVVEGTTRAGRVTLWLAEENSLIKKVVLRKGLDDVLETTLTLRQLNEMATSSQYRYERCIITLVNSRYELAGNALVPVEASMREEKVRQDGTSYNCEYLFRRRNIQLDPQVDPAKDFVIDLPNKSPVFNWDDQFSGVRYEWRDGSTRPAYVDFQEGAERPPVSRSWVILVNVGVVGALLLLVGLRYYLRRRHAP